MTNKRIALICFMALKVSLFHNVLISGSQQDEHGVLYPTTCEVCKYLAVELESRLEETGKTHDVVVIGYDAMSSKQKTKEYKKSELRLVESLEGICDRILEYNIHKERKDSTRFAKGMSQTFQTLHGLVNKGVKVDLGIPYDLWDKPSAEVVAMKSQCETLLEKHEDDIENWFFHHQDVPLKNYLCIQKALMKQDQGCITEVLNIASSAKEQNLKKKNGKPKKNQQSKKKKREEL